MMATQEHPEFPLPHLETFSKAAELCSFTAAAKTLGITQAAVSQRIHALEQALALALFQRKGGRVFLTEAGQRLYPFGQRILALHRQAFEEITGQERGISGELRLAASSIPGEHLLPAMLSIFRRQYPEIRVRVTVTDSVDVVNQVEKGTTHLGLVGRKNDVPHLEFEPFATDEMMAIVPPNHAWRRVKRVSFKRFAKEPLILREEGSGSRWCFEQALVQAGTALDELHVALELGSNEAIKEAVLQGMGVAVVSTHTVRKELAAKHLHAVRVARLALERNLFIVRDRRRVLPAPARLFLSSLEPRPSAEFEA